MLEYVQKQFTINKKLGVAFISFEKAFELINKNL